MPASLYQSNFNLERIPSTDHMDMTRDSAVKLAMELANLCSFNNGGLDLDCDTFQGMSSLSDDLKSKKSQNMTECVPVPSSEHVAEIVGRQGE